MTRTGRTVVVGASVAGLTTAETLRARGYDGSLTLVGSEPHAPYDRPPLSKQVLAGGWSPDRITLRAADALAGLDADLLLGRSAVGLDVAARRLTLDDGGRLGFDQLVIATGVVPRTLPGAELTGVHVLRTVDDSVALRAALLERPAVVVVGAGFLGAEVAATARGLGVDVTLVDPFPVPMYRQLGERVGTAVAELHADHGVVVRCGVGVRRLVPAAGRVVGVELDDGVTVPADVVVVAVGASPAVGWLAGSGLATRDGVECDDRCQAAPGIYAAGDVASWPNAHFGTRMRLEHRTNASEQAMAVADNLLGADRPFTPVPYFWTDQFDTRIQAYGILPPGATMAVLHGDVASRRFVAAYCQDGHVVGVVGWDSARELRRARRLVVDRAPLASLPAA